MLQQNERFSEIEEKYKSLNGKTSSLFAMEEDVLKVSKKVRLLCASCESLQRWRFKGSFHPNNKRSECN